MPLPDQIHRKIHSEVDKGLIGGGTDSVITHVRALVNTFKALVVD